MVYNGFDPNGGKKKKKNNSNTDKKPMANIYKTIFLSTNTFSR